MVTLKHKYPLFQASLILNYLYTEFLLKGKFTA